MTNTVEAGQLQEMDGDDHTAGRMVRFSAQDGLMLAARIFGDATDRMPVICLPGLSRNSRDFLALGHYLAQESAHPRQVVALDYRGRGHSDRDRNWQNYSILVEAQDVLAATSALGIVDGVFVGTSRGGLITMVLSAMRPGMIAGAVLNDVGPVIDGRGLARIKAYIAGSGPVSDWESAVTKLKASQGTTFPELTEEDWQTFAKAIFRHIDGQIRPDYDPKLRNVVSSIDLERPIPDMWNQFVGLCNVPVFSIRGELSDLLREDVVEEMAERHGSLERLVVPAQGHAPLLNDTTTIARIDAFASRCEAQRH